MNPVLPRRALLSGSLAMSAAVALPELAPRRAEAASSARIEIVRSPGGIVAWLVRQSHLPIIAMDFAVRGGSAQDPADKGGVANLLAAMIDEGAGNLDSQGFHQALEDRAIELSFSAARDTFAGSMRMLTEHREEAFRLLKLAFSTPRFDREPLERIRQTLLASIRRSSTNPNAIANETFWGTAFPGHPYGRRGIGTAASVAALQPDDLRTIKGRVLAREHLKVAVVGDIAPDELARVLDDVFGVLPEKAGLSAVPDVAMAGLGERKIMPLDIPQTIVAFGLPGLKRADPDFIPAFVTNHVLGGGSFSSRLYGEVREKRGLAYSVSSGLVALEAAGLVTGGTSTRNDRAGESLAVIQAEIARMGESGPTAEELEQAKRYLIGSWAMRFETSNAIAGNLIRIQLDGFGPDYLERRNDLIEAVTLDDVRRVSKRLFGDPRLLVAAVGKPAGF